MQDKFKPALRRRYEFIEFQLMWEGAIGRKLLQQKFGISPQQSTLDLTAYLDLAPENMVYDTRRRTYVARSSFTPVFTKGHASEYLLHLEMYHHGYRDADEIWPTHIPDFDAVNVATRRVEPSVLKAVLQAIRERRCAEVMYVSLSSESEAPRNLFPHAIASDGHRWHMRAYDIDKGRYSDFVLSRIETIEVRDCVETEFSPDDEWLSEVALCLQPDPKLSERRRKRLELEYEMENGGLEVRVRKAMLFYYLRSFGFDPFELEGGKMRNKSSFNLSVTNLDEVDECIGRRN